MTTTPLILLLMTAIMANRAIVSTAAPLKSSAGPVVTSQQHMKIYINNYSLTMSENGTVNGTLKQPNDDLSTVWDRMTVNNQFYDGSDEDGNEKNSKSRDKYQIKVLLRSMLSCNFLCMNECGYTYTAAVPNKECVWNEVYNSHYEIYLFKRWNKRRLYLAVNVEGKIKRASMNEHGDLGKFAANVAVIYKNWVAVNQTIIVSPMCADAQTILGKLMYKPKKTCTIPPPSRKRKRQFEYGLGDSYELPILAMWNASKDDQSGSDSGAEELLATPNDTLFDEGVEDKNYYKNNGEDELSIHLLPKTTTTTTTTTTTISPRDVDGLVNRLMGEAADTEDEGDDDEDKFGGGPFTMSTLRPRHFYINTLNIVNNKCLVSLNTKV
ncbi:Fibroblast growth factor [Perigonia lusca single nucleopolyhedrovirus]|uniref:Fibroblast growth factor n=1 Tax=Perigonia lusca single nucleopolyhedrovirus TaxID=1675865 RepID=A0A0M3WR21_9ABAC|nr:Fibroblast growth factor [Perigonia lusca single nucleopolyhedrovirus]AKN80612.1 Fibroblast growth factor [Perigonia lusca single nucleopolyhedrovirus]